MYHFFQNDLEQFKCGSSPHIFYGVSPKLQGEKLHTPSHLPHAMKDMAATWYKGKVD